LFDGGDLGEVYAISVAKTLGCISLVTDDIKERGPHYTLMRIPDEVNMIREFKSDELEIVMKIWLETNIRAHNFIPESYWRKNYETVKGTLPDATIIVYEDGHIIQGFVGLMGNYIAGIFVNEKCQSQGVGKALLDHIKENHAELSLHVYKKNVRAVKFYLRESFVVFNEQIDENTGEAELVMNWTK
jgi:putative acetyltransferase